MFGFNFGIEIEALGLVPEALRRALLRKGMTGSYSYLAFPEDSRTTFGVKHDGSIGIGSEIMTGILQENNLPLVKKLLVLLKECGMAQGPKCGIHVHVGLPAHIAGMNRWCDEAKAFNDVMYQNWNTTLPRILRSYAPRKERYRYCKTDFRRNELANERYLAINTTQARHPTAEFRFFDTHLDYRYTCRAVRLACGLTYLALNGIRLKEFGPGESIESRLKVYESRMTSQRRMI